MFERNEQGGQLFPPGIVQQADSIDQRASRLRDSYKRFVKNIEEMGGALNALKEQCIVEHKAWLPVLAQTGIPVSTANRWMRKACKKLHPESAITQMNNEGQDEEEKEEPDSETIDESLTDGNGMLIPERLRSVFEAVPAFIAAKASANNAAKALQRAEESAPYCLAIKAGNGDQHRYSTLCSTAALKMDALRPELVCPNCHGIEASQDNEDCTRCNGKGYLTAGDNEKIRSR